VKKRLVSMIATAAMLITLVPLQALAASANVTITDVTSKNPGDTVTISGTSTFSEVVIKVVRPDSTVLYYDVVIPDSGAYTQSFKLPSNAALGVYTIAAGNGTDVATDEFPVAAASADTSVAPAAPVVTTPPANAEDGEDQGVTLDEDAAVVTIETTADGKAVTKVSLDAAKLGDAFGLLKNKNKDSQIITVEVKGSAPVAKVEFPGSALTQAATAAPEAIVDIQSEGASYQLPVKVLKLEAIAKELGADAKDVTVNVTMEKVSGSTAAQIETKASSSGLKLLAGAVEFTINVEANGKTQELNNFGDTYVSRTIDLAQAVDPSRTTAVLYDRATGEISFVPAVFTTVNGATKATVKRNGNSIYTVVESHKTFRDLNGHWAKQEVELLASKLVIKGITETDFAPGSEITRAQFASLLVRALGLTEDKTSAQFNDVRAADWYAGAIGAAVKGGLVTGFENNAFKPNDRITRQEMAVMISRAIKTAGTTVDVSENQNQLLSQFKDKTAISSWAEQAVAQSIDAKIINGMTASSFAPAENASRAQAAVMLKRLLQYVQFMN
jgi:hypothetical protein